MLEGLFYVDQDTIQNLWANAYTHINMNTYIYIYICNTLIYIYIYTCVYTPAYVVRK